MSDFSERDFDARLLDLHLGHLSRAEEAELRAKIESEPALVEQDRALTSVFTALRAVPTEAAPRDLAGRVSQRVREAGPVPRVVRPTDQWTAALEERPERIIQLGSLRDVIGIAAIVVLAIGLGVPGLMHARERSDRLACTRNLQMLGTGVQQYASTFGSSLPFAGFAQAGNSWLPSDDPQITTVPNRRHVFLLLRRNFVRDPRVFVCPSQHDVPMPMDAVAQRSDFLEPRNVSYAYQNMAGVRPSPKRDAADLPILSDDNPLFADGLPLFDARRLGIGDPAQSNSHAHRSAGQNILTLDGRVKWTTTPNSGVNGDNIWTLEDVDEYTGQEGPSKSTDAHLLK